MKLIIKEVIKPNVKANFLEEKLYKLADLYNEEIDFETLQEWVTMYGNTREKSTFHKELKPISGRDTYRLGDILTKFRIHLNKKE